MTMFLFFPCDLSTLLPFHTDAIDFMRDLLAYVVVLAIIVAVAYDGKVSEI